MLDESAVMRVVPNLWEAPNWCGIRQCGGGGVLYVASRGQFMDECVALWRFF